MLSLFRRRENLLDVTAADVRDVAQRYLVDRKGSPGNSTVVLGAEKDWASSDNGWDIYSMGNEASEDKSPEVSKL